MNNGQKTQNPGVGIFSIDQPISESENNLDLTNNQTIWSPERDKRSVGNKAIFSSNELSEAPQPSENANQNESIDTDAVVPENPHDLGQIVNIDTPRSTTDTDAPAFNAEAIRVNGDHLSSSALGEIKRAQSELNQTGNIAYFYDEIRGMMAKNLENSYNRKLVA